MHLFKILHTHVYQMSISFSFSLQLYTLYSNCTKPRILKKWTQLLLKKWISKKNICLKTIITCIKQLFLGAWRYVFITQLLHWVWHYDIMNSWRPSYIYCFISGLFGKRMVCDWVSKRLTPSVGIFISIAMLWEKRNTYGSMLLITI